VFDKTLDISRFLLAVSSINSLADPVLSNHNYRVAYISFLIARRLTYNNQFLSKIIMAGLLHDIGLLLSPTKDLVLVKNPELREDGERIHLHSEVGYKLLKNFPMFSKIALTIKYHHLPYKDFLLKRKTIPYSSQVLHLADRIDVFISVKLEGREAYLHFPKVVKELEGNLKKSSHLKLLDPRLVNLFLKEIAVKEAFWFELFNEAFLKESLQSFLSNYAMKLPFEAFFELAQILAYLIDFKSPFTATHSSGVAQTATSLASLLNFTLPDLKKIKVAGLLHDIGKVAIPREILEKKGKLTSEEMNLMKSHVYYSYKIISKLELEKNILEWASYHHETLDGKGYPFKLTAKDLSLGSRIMAVADIYTALMEDRPYKKGMDTTKALEVLTELAEANKLDKRIVNLLKNNLSTVEKARKMAQERAQRIYDSLREIVKSFKAV
jgi:putative nucleotidyltransferase with HDIG domain